jgi:hypothetical protein
VTATKPTSVVAGDAVLANDIKPSVTVLPASVMPHRVPWSVWPLAGTTVGLMAVSLTHLSDGVTQLTAIPSWQAWAMAVGIDCMLISVALAQLTAAPDVKRDINLVARCMEAGTLVMSAGLNALAFTGGAFDAAHWAQVAFGCFVPAAISGADLYPGPAYTALISALCPAGELRDTTGAGSPPALFHARIWLPLVGCASNGSRLDIVCTLTLRVLLSLIACKTWGI